jgi:hypothetical protein
MKILGCGEKATLVIFTVMTYIASVMTLLQKHITKKHVRLDVRGSVHHSTIYEENPTRCNNVLKLYYSILI